MKSLSIIIALLFSTVLLNAQIITLPSFIKWSTNNSPDCKNVFITKDSITLAVKNKCTSEGILANWRPLAGIDDELKISVPAGAKVKLTIGYTFTSVLADVFSFYGSFDPESDNSDIAFSRSLKLENSDYNNLPPSGSYIKATLLINFSNESDKPIWKAQTALKGSMNFHFNVTSAGGETHTGSKAVIKDIKLELIN